MPSLPPSTQKPKTYKNLAEVLASNKSSSNDYDLLFSSVKKLVWILSPEPPAPLVSKIGVYVSETDPLISKS